MQIYPNAVDHLTMSLDRAAIYDDGGASAGLPPGLADMLGGGRGDALALEDERSQAIPVTDKSMTQMLLTLFEHQAFARDNKFLVLQDGPFVEWNDEMVGTLERMGAVVVREFRVRGVGGCRRSYLRLMERSDSAR